jgi:hypothetical protein
MPDFVNLPDEWHLTGKDAIVQGASWNRYVGIDYTDPATGDLIPWDTTGYTARLTVRAYTGGPVVLECTTENGRLQTGVTTSDGQVWACVLDLTPAATKDLPDWGVGVYVWELKDTFGNETRIHDGQCAMRTGDA